MATSWPKSLETLFGTAELMTKRVAEMTNGRFKITPYAPGEIVGGLEVMDAVLGVNVQNIAGGEVYLALDRGAIDAPEWVRPFDD
jgi:TRAP-type mannitol/chloroaromatic compound transport system substrate-binding protein